MRHALTLLATLAATLSLGAATVHGVVRDADGTALPGVTVYEKGSSDTIVTDRDGHFTIGVASLPAQLVAFLGGFDAVTVTAGREEVEIRLKLAAVSDTVTVTARAPRFASMSSYDLKPLDIYRTPGAQADVFKALQTLPGVVKVDDGAGLFVRGGDVSEVRVLLDGATIQHPFRYESPAGGQYGSIPPLLLEGIAFSTGGFSARYGNVLSAVLDLRGLGKPSTEQLTATAGLAGLSARADVPVGETAGIRGSGNVSSTRLLFDVNGAPRQFDREPASWDANVSGHLESASLGSLKIFAMARHDGVGVDLQRGGFDGFLHSSSNESSAIASWKKAAGPWQLAGVLGADSFGNGVDIGVLDLHTTDRRLDGRFDAARGLGGAILRIGVDAERADTRIDGTKSIQGQDFNGAGGTSAFHAVSGDTHGGTYAEVEETFGRFTPTLGLRVDDDRLVRAVTADPRLNVTFAVSPQQKLRFAWGLFHQAPAPDYFDRVSGALTLKPMEAEHWIAGYEIGTADGPAFVRAEAYEKRYRDLPLQSATAGYTSAGYGFARGIDLFSSKKWQGLELRASYSLLTARRCWTPYDQQARFDLPAGAWRPDFDIPQVLSLVASSQLTQTIGAGLTWTSAAGKPTTPILGARQAPYGLAPIYGPINSERLPRYERCDVNVTYRPRTSGRTALIYFIAVNNLFARRNVSDYAWNADYTARTPVVSAAPRSFYFGLTAIR